MKQRNARWLISNLRYSDWLFCNVSNYTVQLVSLKQPNTGKCNWTCGAVPKVSVRILPTLKCDNSNFIDICIMCKVLEHKHFVRLFASVFLSLPFIKVTSGNTCTLNNCWFQMFCLFHENKTKNMLIWIWKKNMNESSVFENIIGINTSNVLLHFILLFICLFKILIRNIWYPFLFVILYIYFHFLHTMRNSLVFSLIYFWLGYFAHFCNFSNLFSIYTL